MTDSNNPTLNIEEHFDPAGKLHRLDGPAVIYPDGTKIWYLDGIQLPFGNYCEKLGLSEAKVQELCTKFDMAPLNSLGMVPPTVSQ